MKTLYVRVQPKSGQETFFRCGMQFGKEWKAVDVDDATATRLEAEQMLEVKEDLDGVIETLFPAAPAAEAKPDRENGPASEPALAPEAGNVADAPAAPTAEAKTDSEDGPASEPVLAPEAGNVADAPAAPAAEAKPDSEAGSAPETVLAPEPGSMADAPAAPVKPAKKGAK